MASNRSQPLIIEYSTWGESVVKMCNWTRGRAKWPCTSGLLALFHAEDPALAKPRKPVMWMIFSVAVVSFLLC